MVEDRVKTYSLYGNTELPGRSHLGCNVGEPGRPRFILSPGLRDEERTLIAIEYLFQNLMKRTISGVADTDR